MKEWRFAGERCFTEERHTVYTPSQSDTGHTETKTGGFSFFIGEWMKVAELVQCVRECGTLKTANSHVHIELQIN